MKYLIPETLSNLSLYCSFLSGVEFVVVRVVESACSKWDARRRGFVFGGVRWVWIYAG